MITLHRNESSASLSLTPRPGFRRKATSKTLDLIYGHHCPVCGNVVQAFFRTGEEVKLWAYEETTVLSQGQNNMGEILKVVPDEKYDEGESCYRSYFYKVDSGKNAQKIILKNHLMRPGLTDLARGCNERTQLWEVGERTCPFTAVFSPREDLAIKDIAFLLEIPPEELDGYNLPTTLQQLLPNAEGTPVKSTFRWARAIGNAPPILFVSRDTINATHSYWLKKLLEPYKKQTNK